MKISILKKTPYLATYKICRSDGSTDAVTFDTKTYFEHDICHYVVEKKLHYHKGFWGMLADGKNFAELSGKNNPTTEQLRFIEKIVGPVQSVYWGHLPPEKFGEFTAHLQYPLPENFAPQCAEEIRQLTNRWRQLPVGGSFELQWQIV